MKINYKNSNYLWRMYFWCYPMLIRLLKLNKLISFFREGISIPHVFLKLEGPICGVPLFSMDRISVSLLYEVFKKKKQIKNIFFIYFLKIRQIYNF